MGEKRQVRRMKEGRLRDGSWQSTSQELIQRNLQNSTDRKILNMNKKKKKFRKR